MSVVRMCRAAVPHMRAARRRQHPQHHRDLAMQPIAGFGLSVATWAAVMGFAKTASLELAGPASTSTRSAPARSRRSGCRRFCRRRSGCKGCANFAEGFAAAHRHGRGRRQPGRLAGVAARQLHHRNGHPGRWRPVSCRSLRDPWPTSTCHARTRAALYSGGDWTNKTFFEFIEQRAAAHRGEVLPTQRAASAMARSRTRFSAAPSFIAASASSAATSSPNNCRTGSNLRSRSLRSN